MLEPTRNPLLLPEIVGAVLDNVNIRDLLSCAGVNRTWNTLALKRMYEGSVYDLQRRTPDITSLNCLYVASRERFARCMGHVKHLLIAPEHPVEKKDVGMPKKFVSLEKFRPLRDPESAKRLFQAYKPGVKSLMIPFGMHGWEQSYIDVLLTETVEFLAIDDSFCPFLEPAYRPVGNIKALTIYKSGSNRDVTSLCSLIDRCDLHFFHIEDSREPEPMSDDHTTQLIECLARQRNLKALALMIPEVLSPLARVVENGNPWPGLKALYYGQYDDRFSIPPVVRLPRFNELEILSIPRIDPLLTIIGRDPGIKNRLRVLHLELADISDTEPVLDILPGCNSLQKLSLGELDDSGPAEAYANFFQRLPPLPSLQCLVIPWVFKMKINLIQHVASLYPQLTVLDLSQADLTVSLNSLQSMSSITQLQVLQLSEIPFNNPRRWMRGTRLQQLATEWKRVFPSLRTVPYGGDNCTFPMTSQAVREHLLSEPDEFAYPPDSDFLMGRLCTVLGYRARIDSHLDYDFQTKMENEIIGWPVVPFVAFQHTDSYSTYSV
ncbi:predicted protein [Aspergillus nidulans FGSC A4]|uniref:F-box domain-containing protein n=1 Tax=Emericella nidulans (strain FGSC A4 / ATCC 38163 / CBS 112.46 / NRRL 194 / M139) TaxID=227321 RepID=Q5AUA2_EMENI|nr:hypothetical protein [Aspergillus nidulans FGSC A4]EAA59750.1 predicted protein [Aspergillus nidulans FGSC A4]CBF73942.1 TPA: conserved hypothetical protein [Aspergillus nidulans FGSC A4]|eukprot:XP_681397.1 predicted protein [Aspergillus nidulans FGSC A4]